MKHNRKLLVGLLSLVVCNSTDSSKSSICNTLPPTIDKVMKVCNSLPPTPEFIGYKFGKVKEYA